MCIPGLFGGGPSIPRQAPPPPPPAPRPAPKRADPEIARSRARNRQRAALAGGRQSIIRTSAQGLTTPASTAKKRLLGQ